MHVSTYTSGYARIRPHTVQYIMQ